MYIFAVVEVKCGGGDCMYYICSAFCKITYYVPSIRVQSTVYVGTVQVIVYFQHITGMEKKSLILLKSETHDLNDHIDWRTCSERCHGSFNDTLDD